jgi:hypothetical protein
VSVGQTASSSGVFDITGANLDADGGSTVTFPDGGILNTADQTLGSLVIADGSVTLNSDVTVSSLQVDELAALSGGSGAGSSLTVTGTSTLDSSLSNMNEVTLDGAVTLGTSVDGVTIGADGDVTFGSTVDGADDLTVNLDQTTVFFNGSVGGVTPLESLTVTGTGASAAEINCAFVGVTGEASFAPSWVERRCPRWGSRRPAPRRRSAR